MWPFKKKNHDIPTKRTLHRYILNIPTKRTLHHYILAHVALKRVCFDDPFGFFALMASPHRQKFLDDLWTQICQNCNQEGEAHFSPRDIKIETTRVGEYPAIVVEMPTPRFIAEAHMICVVLKVPVNELQQETEKAEVRYFTLEKGINFKTGGDRTVLCAWDGESHINYGDGPVATPAAFIDAVKKLL
jgi:hypothetical protein